MAFIDVSTLILTVVTVASSTVAGIFGMGGGMILIAVLPNFLPATAIIPIHACVQLFSNGSRALFQFGAIEWPLVREFTIGSIAGILLGYLVFTRLDLAWLPLIIGLYILASTWTSFVSKIFGALESIRIIGGIQTAVSLLVGAPGPIAMPLLLKKLNDHHRIVCTMAIFLMLSHALKLLVFLWSGFPFNDYIQTIIYLLVAATGGSWLGTKIRIRINVEKYKFLVKWLLTALAVSAIIQTGMQLFIGPLDSAP